MLRSLFLLCVIVLHVCAAEGDQIQHEQWYQGTINGEKAMSAHEVITQHSNGSSSLAFSTKIRIARSLFGIPQVLEVSSKRKFTEDQNGNMVSFDFEDNENGVITTAIGTIDGSTITATVTRPTGNAKRVVEIPDSKKIYGQAASQELMNDKLSKVGDSLKFSGVEMISGRIQLVTTTAILKSIKANGNKIVSATVDIMPMPIDFVINKEGRMVSMTMNLGGFMKITLVPTNKQVVVNAATLDIKDVIKHKGPAPKLGTNRYKIDKDILNKLLTDEFQEQNNDILTVKNTARKSELPEKHAFLNKELQLEIDDPELIAWSKKQLANHQDASVAKKAEVLCLAVRSYITKKDLSKGDATALETFKSRCGDCTEHANLLTAALRINGIPARSEVGFVFPADFGTWVGHAWNSAYDSEQQRWIHLDAAYPGVQRSSYIKSATSSGDDSQSTGKAMTLGITALMGQEIQVLAD